MGSHPEPIFDLTPDQAAEWEAFKSRTKDLRIVGEAVPGLKDNGTKVLENVRRVNGLCAVRLARYGREPDLPGEVGSVSVGAGLRPARTVGGIVRWREEDVPMFYVYAWWRSTEGVEHE